MLKFWQMCIEKLCRNEMKSCNKGKWDVILVIHQMLSQDKGEVWLFLTKVGDKIDLVKSTF